MAYCNILQYCGQEPTEVHRWIFLITILKKTKKCWHLLKKTLTVTDEATAAAVVLPGKKEKQEPFSRGRLISGAEVGVDLQGEQQKPETHKENRQDQLVPQRHPQSQQAVDFHHLGEQRDM